VPRALCVGGCQRLRDRRWGGLVLASCTGRTAGPAGASVPQGPATTSTSTPPAAATVSPASLRHAYAPCQPLVLPAADQLLQRLQQSESVGLHLQVGLQLQQHVDAGP